MIKELVIHAGDCKTGSTSIQKALRDVSWSAPGHTVCYPASGNHNLLARSMRMESEAKNRAKHFAKAREQLLASDADVGVISAEDFEFVDPSLLRVAIDNHLPEFKDNLRIIAYIRPHHERLISAFAERSKQTARIDSMEELHESFAKIEFLNYTARLESWRAAFGEAYTVRAMIRSNLVNKDVVADFFQFVFRGAPVSIQMERDANSSLSMEDLVMLREVHNAIRKENPNLVEPQRAFGWNFADFLREHQAERGTKLKIHKSLARMIVETSQEDAARIDEMFMVGTPMTDALHASVDTALDEPQSLDVADYFSTRHIGHIHAMGQFICRMMESDSKTFIKMSRDPVLRKRRIAINEGLAGKGVRKGAKGKVLGPGAKPRKKPGSKQVRKRPMGIVRDT